MPGAGINSTLLPCVRVHVGPHSFVTGVLFQELLTVLLECFFSVQKSAILPMFAYYNTKTVSKLTTEETQEPS